MSNMPRWLFCYSKWLKGIERVSWVMGSYNKFWQYGRLGKTDFCWKRHAASRSSVFLLVWQAIVAVVGISLSMEIRSI